VRPVVRLRRRDCPTERRATTTSWPNFRRRVAAIEQKHPQAIEQTDDSFHLETVIATRFRFGDMSVAKLSAPVEFGCRQ